jgi:hypothetical protein
VSELRIEADAENDVLAAFIHNGSVATCFMESFLAAFAEDAMRHSRGGHRRRLVEYQTQQGPYIQSNRSLVAKYFLRHTAAQWLWWLDNDIEFPPDSLYRLLRAAEVHECGILGAAYWNQYGASSESTTGRYLSWLLFTDEGVRAVENLPEEVDPCEVTAVGMGCTLIHRDVVAAVDAAHPEHPWSTFGADLLRYDDGTSDVMGEDVTFCLRAQRAGYKTYGLPSLIVEHHKAHFMAHGEEARPEARVNGGRPGGRPDAQDQLATLDQER